VQVIRITGNRGAGYQQTKESGYSQLALQLSRILYKSGLFMQNKADFRRVRTSVRIYATQGYEKTPAFCVPESKPKQSQLAEKAK